jgi:hypothetical protein
MGSSASALVVAMVWCNNRIEATDHDDASFLVEKANRQKRAEKICGGAVELYIQARRSSQETSE